MKEFVNFGRVILDRVPSVKWMGVSCPACYCLMLVAAENDPGTLTCPWCGHKDEAPGGALRQGPATEEGADRASDVVRGGKG